MSILLALASAVVYGVADWCGGRAARSRPAVLVALLGQIVSLLLVVGTVLVIGTAFPPATDLWWGALGGALGAVGLGTFYYALANGEMSVVAPITAVVTAVLPVVVGLAVGERPRPVAYVGIAIAVAAVALVSGAVGERHHTTPRRILVLAGVAGLGFGSLFVAIDRTRSASGLWPLVGARLASVPLLALVALVARVGVRGAAFGRWRGSARTLVLPVTAGILDMAANVLFLVANSGGLLSIVAVVGSLYPASTVLLAARFDGERIRRSQGIGMVCAACALALVTLGRA